MRTLASTLSAPVALASAALGVLLTGGRLPEPTDPACTDLSPGTAERGAPLESAAHDLLALYRRWDDARHDARFAAGDADRLARRLAWFKDQLGECAPGEPLFRRSDLLGRYLYTCERGQLEAEFTLDATSSKVRKLYTGARDLQPPAPVLTAAGRALDLLAAWDGDAFPHLFGPAFAAGPFERFLADVRARWGACRIAGVDLASERGALLDLACERGDRLMILDLADDGRIARFLLTARRDRTAL